MPRRATISAVLATVSGLHFASAAPVNITGLSFDYVVVGAGPGGLTVASRLSEDPSVSVAVVEAGTWSTDVTGNQSQVPAYDFYYNGKSPEDTNPLVEWGFVTTPQAGINDQAVHYTRGKALGGSSTLNYMGYTHTTAGALQQWADAVGDASYAYESSSYYYRKSMNFTTANTELRLDNATTSEEVGSAATGGPLGVTYSSWAQSFSTYIAITMDALGIRNTNAFINGNLNGSSWLTSTVNADTGHRESAQVAYLDPAVSRPNLRVFDLTMGERIVFDEDRVARGVVVTTANQTYTIRARREVIVSAGAFQSPQLLQVSGVGPADLLRQFDIPVVADRPGVGKNLQDHVFFGISYRVNVPTASALQYGDAQEVAEEQFNANGTGPLASPGGDYAGFEKLPQDIRSSFADETLAELDSVPEDWPEMQYLTLPTYAGDFQSISAGSPDDGYMYATIFATLLSQSSVGNISISSSSMSDQPLINPNWMTSQRDIDLIIGGFKRLRQIFEAPSMANVTIGPEYYPGASVQSDDEIHSQIQQSFNTMYHAAASCKMGVASDPEAVVDNHGRVYGVSNLRVVDVSAFPFLPPGLPQATVYMLAEKIADSIKNGN